MGEEKKLTELDGNKAILYMLFALEAKMNAQTKIIVEMAEIITQKDPGTITNEMALNTLTELRKIRDRFVEDDELLAMIKKMEP